MFKFFAVLLLLVLSFQNGFGAPSNSTVPTVPTTTTPGPTEEYDTIYCDFLPDPFEPDEGNYGDGYCEIKNKYDRDELLLREILTSEDMENYLTRSYEFSGTVVTRVKLLNFGRYHGAANAIDITNENGHGSVYLYVDCFLGKAVRMFVEIYGFH